MEERTTGLILRTRPLTETSLIVNWLTADVGRVATVAKGARRAQSPLRGKLDLFYVAEFSFVRSRRSELHTLKEVDLRDTHAALRREVELLQQAAYAAALIEQTTERETPVPEVYALARGYLAELARHDWRAEATLWFELKLLGELGLQPDPATARVSARTRKLMVEAMAAPWAGVFQLQPDAGQVKELIRFLHGFLIHHLDRLPKGRAAALRECA